ncbi:MAG: hypothetical protein ABI980_08420, partial [Nitrospirota bacterium]
MVRSCGRYPDRIRRHGRHRCLRDSTGIWSHAISHPWRFRQSDGEGTAMLTLNINDKDYEVDVPEDMP